MHNYPFYFAPISIAAQPPSIILKTRIYRIPKIINIGTDATIHFNIKIIIEGIDIFMSVITTCCSVSDWDDGVIGGMRGGVSGRSDGSV